ncbi:MAG: tetratricopeptide repeat protein [Mucilaginibacter sp.]
MMKFAPDEPHDIDTAISLLKQAIDCDPQFLAAYVNLANAYDKSNDYDKELAVINKELALSKSDPSILLNKARLFEKSNKVDSAKNIYGLTQIILDEKLKKQPNNIGLIQSKILLLALTVGKDEAMKELNHQINICPEYKKELQSEYLYFKNFDRHSYIYGYSVVQSF